MTASKSRNTPRPLPALLRRAILESIPQQPFQSGEVPPKYLYLPRAHLRALQLDSMLVVGMRGAGKSFWWYALLDPAIRSVVLGNDIAVGGGFGLKSSRDWPDRDELNKLVKANQQPRLIWKTIVLRQVARTEMPEDWEGAVEWVASQPSRVAAALREADEKLRQGNKKHLVVFDALDTTAADSPLIESALLRGLLQLVVELRAFSSIRAKLFVRPDMLDDPKVKDFTDSSKAIASAVHLKWSTADLYGLLFQYLANGDDDEASAAFRDLTGERWEYVSLAWCVPEALRDSATQESVFAGLAGPWMGMDRRRGKTYTWVPNHLADAHDQVSPRSVLAAILGAAVHGIPDGHPSALHWKGIHEGVRAASKYRVTEIAEDFAWVHRAMELLRDLVVPCEKARVLGAWKKPLIKEWKDGKRATRLGAETSDGEFLESVFNELQRVGVLQVLRDERINIPDVYRVGFGLRRKGGFTPRE